MSDFPQKLATGYHHFRAGTYSQRQQDYQNLAAQGQVPETMVIACCDSRAAPEVIFSAGPGEIFVTRNVANLVPPYNPDDSHHATSAALEFAVQSLHVKNIVVMGHGRCGGIQAALSPDMPPLSPGDFIGKWMDLLTPTAQKVNAIENLSPSERQRQLEYQSIRFSLQNLRTFPCVEILEGRGKLNLYGAWFDISEGDLLILDEQSGVFNPA